MYSKADITQWILGAFKVQNRQGSELNFACPSCGHESCYFNVAKVAGYCHRASCHRTFNLESMIDIIGYAPDLAGYIPGMEAEETQVREVRLPNDSEPILQNHEDVSALYMRGVDWEMIQKFKLYRNNTHIIVPIYEDGELVQYNSRRINRNVPTEKWFSAIPPSALRYKYAKGHSITNFLLGWEESKRWATLVLVENTFVSMWLRDLHTTTNFGSFLSATHIDKIVHSNVKHVTFLWDEGADAQKAQRALKKVGVPSNIIYIEGQPDDYNKSKIKELLQCSN
ncbi:hypothetical protein LCGC14_2441300 [marine sediment metagenome]|uniref:Toprim domain-containing protein n=1 Tax=marine sediment metagenome TaxID=412755 RepID=A0A0F9BJ18_9ZZZZ